MLKRIASNKGEAGKDTSVDSKTARKARKAEHKDLGKYINRQRTLVFASRGISHRDRHFMQDIRDLLPHSKKDVKFDDKAKLAAVNEIADMKNCNNVIFFEARKRKDLFMWVSRTPHGPSAKFLLQNIHTLAEVKLTGNCLKGSRPLLQFDPAFDADPAYRLLKELFVQVFGSPKGHAKVKPFVDHIMSFFIADNRIWFRNYQIVYEPEEGKKGSDPVLVEIGPRFVLNPIRIFDGSFGGPTLWENPHYVSPNLARARVYAAKAEKYETRVKSKQARAQYEADTKAPVDELADVFAPEYDQEEAEEEEAEEEEEAQGAGAKGKKARRRKGKGKAEAAPTAMDEDGDDE